MSDYGTITEAGAVRFERLLPAPVERVWKYLTDAKLRASWFAGGPMELKPGGSVELTFRNSDLAPAGEEVPKDYRQYEGMVSTGEVLRAEPPRRLVWLWHEDDGTANEVSWELEPRGDETLMILTHSRLPNRKMVVGVSGGWHLHLDVLGDVLAGGPRRPFWSANARYAEEYEARIPKDVPV